MKQGRTKYKDRILVIFVYVSALVFIAGCTAKKSVVEKIKKKEETQIVLPTKAELVVTNICDSVNLVSGKEKKVDYVFEKGPVSGKLEVRGDIVSLVINTDSVVSTNKESDVLREKEVIRYRTDFKILLLTLIIGFLIGFLKPWKYL